MKAGWKIRACKMPAYPSRTHLLSSWGLLISYLPHRHSVADVEELNRVAGKRCLDGSPKCSCHPYDLLKKSPICRFPF